MSVANSQNVRRNAAPGMNTSVPGQRAAARASTPAARTGFFARGDQQEDEIKVNVADLQISRTQELEVEGFKPSLLSRLFDLISPSK
jgi:hypothetical protein